MANKSGPGIDWFTIRYEHIFKVFGLLLAVVVVGGGAWFLKSYIGSPRTKAKNALASAREIINKVGSEIESANRQDLGKRLQSGKLRYEEGEAFFRQKKFKEAENAAIDAENVARKILGEITTDNALANVAAIEGVVEIQRSGKHVFERLGKGDELNEGDTIKTSPGSVCQVSYQGGSQITIGEDTLYVIKRLNRERAEFELEGKADFELTEGTKVRVVDDKATLDLENQSESTVSTAGDSFTVDLFAGDANLTDHTGQQSSITAGESAQVTEQGTVIEKLPEAPEPQAPANNYTYTHEDPTSITIIFKWSSMLDTTSYELQLSPRPLFSQTIDLKELATTELNNMDLQGLPAGIYFWRVRRINSAGKNSKWSPAQKFVLKQEDKTIDDTPPPNLDFRTEAIGDDLVLVKGKTDAGALVIVDNLQIEVEPSGEFNHLHTRQRLDSDEIEIQACTNRGVCTEKKKHKAW